MPAEGRILDPVSSSSRRALLFGAIGAVVGLLLAGVALFTARGTRTAGVPAEDAAVVNDTPVLRVDLNDQLKALYGVSLAQATPAQRRRVLDQMVGEELMVQRGVETGLPTDDTEVRTALIAGVESQAAAETLMEAPSETVVRAWYEAHLDRFSSPGSMDLQEYLAPAAQAPALLASLAAGRGSGDTGARPSGRVGDGPEFYFAAKLHLGDRIFAVARALRNGEAALAGVDAQGAHVLQMKVNAPPEPTPWPAAEAEVLADYLKARTGEAQAAELRFLHKRAQVRLAADLR